MKRKLQQDYGKCNTLPDKEDFRRKWAAEQYKKMSKRKESITSYSKAKTTKGIYRPFQRIVVEEGGWCDPANIVAALNYCRMCIVLGGEFVKFNKFTKRF